jgi:hypothetical protein
MCQESCLAHLTRGKGRVERNETAMLASVFDWPTEMAECS